MRKTMIAGMLAAVSKNRFYFPALSLIELGSVYRADGGGGCEYRHAGLVMAQRGKQAEAGLLDRLKGAVEGWAWERFGLSVQFETSPADQDRPWEHPHRTAKIVIGKAHAGCISVVPPGVRQKMDEHLAAWSIVWAELHLSNLLTLSPRT